MKIEMNTIYHLPTQAHENDFLRQADKQGLRWKDSKLRADVPRYWNNEIYFIKADLSGLTFGDFQAFVPIVEWKIGFSKADMQIGQMYKIRKGEADIWSEYDNDYYADDLKPSKGTLAYGYDGDDIVEVYPLSLTPIWKREEPKYRVKTELTREQAEKLGLEFCEVVE